MKRMRSKLLRLPLALLLLAPCWSALADDSLSPAYAAILRGDVDSARVELARLRDHGASPGDVARVESWLSAYRKTVDSRAEMKKETFDWNVAEAKKAIEQGEIYLALSFAAQAAPYAVDEQAYSNEPWIAELTTKAMAQARQLEGEHHWSKVHGHYALLKRLHPKDKQYEELRQHAERLARLELLYKDKEELDRRIKDVDKNLLRTAVSFISKNYYRDPDFTKMGEGAIENLIALAETQKTYDYLHGLGNPVTRQGFEAGLKELRDWPRTEERFNSKDLLKLYNRVADLNDKTAELPEGLLVMEFLEGALQQLDEYTSMIWPVDAPDFDKMMMGGFQGVGIQLSLDERSGRLKVVTPLEDSPALEAGIQPDDLIVEVNGQDTKNWSTDDAVRNIMGQAGTEVTMTLFRPSTGQRLTHALKRRNIVLRTVRGVERLPYDTQSWNYMLDEETGVAYLRVNGFHPDTHEELVQSLKAAQRQGMRGLILDLRHNPGGLLDVAVRAVSTFVDNGEVVSTGGRREARTSMRVTDEPFQVNVPMVVLINEGSASASEILAGAFQDHHRAVVLGERSFGKGSVQRVLTLAGSARLKLTTALYYLPSGRSPHKDPDADTWGVSPDVKVVLTPKEFRQVLKHETDTYIIHNSKEQPPAASEEERDKALEALKGKAKDDVEEPLLTEEQIKELDHDPVTAQDGDPQLETALLLLRVKLAANVPWPQQLASTGTETTKQP
jgi:carboxyl-terminal processing protease